MPVYANLNAARLAFHQLNLKKSGKNEYAKYTYFELADFLPQALKIFAENNLCATITFTNNECMMRVVDIEDGSHCFFESPIADAQTKGSLPIQALGSTHTYMRRYMWLLALEIVEHDGIEAVAGNKGGEPVEHEYISATQAGELYDLIEKTGTSLDALTDYYQVETLEMLPLSKFEAARSVLSKRLK